MPITMSLADEFYTEAEFCSKIRFSMPYIIAARGSIDWPPYTCLEGQYYYRKGVADFYIHGDVHFLTRSAIYESATGPQLMIDELHLSNRKRVTSRK